MTSQLSTASCFESISSSGTANANLKQPLVEIQDLESSSSSQEEQNTDNERRRLSSLVLVKSLCFGCFVGLLLQAVAFCAFLVITKLKKWGRNPQPEESAAALSYLTLYWTLYMDLAIYSIIWGGFLWTLTRKGSLYMRKKFDKDAEDAPNNNTESTVWTQRILFLSGIGVLLGVHAGTYTAWVIIEMIELGFRVSFTPLVFTFLMDVGFCYLMVKCFNAYDDSFLV
jgi:hypothetical protein